MLSPGATRLHSAHLPVTQQTCGIANCNAVFSLALMAAIEVSVPSLISQRSTHAQSSSEATQQASGIGETSATMWCACHNPTLEEDTEGIAQDTFTLRANPDRAFGLRAL